MLKQFIKDTPFGVSIILMALAIGLIIMIAPIGGNKALIVRSGSMQPAIGVGDLITVKPQATYKIGDIIAFKDSTKPSIIVTHRIVGQETKDGKIFYRTRGDANEEADFNLVAAQNVVGSAWVGIKGAGRVFAFTKTKTGLFTTIAIPAALVILFEISNLIKEIRSQKNKNKSIGTIYKITLKHLYHHYGHPMGVPHPSSSFRGLFKFPLPNFKFKTILPVLASFLIISNTFSFFSDTETSTGNLFQAADSFGPKPGDIVINEIMWMGMQGNAADEWIELRNMTGNTINLTGWVVENLGTGAGPSGTISIPAGKNIGPDSFFLISNDPKTTSIVDIDPDVVDSSVSLLNPGEALFLRNAIGGTIIDTADNDGGGWFAGDDTNKHEKSMERNENPDDGTTGTNWHTATSQTNIDAGNDEIATPRAANSLP